MDRQRDGRKRLQSDRHKRVESFERRIRRAEILSKKILVVDFLSDPVFCQEQTTESVSNTMHERLHTWTREIEAEGIARS